MANGAPLIEPKRVQLVMPAAEIEALDAWCWQHKMSRSEGLREGARRLMTAEAAKPPRKSR